jgi:hypothetical protein
MVIVDGNVDRGVSTGQSVRDMLREDMRSAPWELSVHVRTHGSKITDDAYAHYRSADK